MTLLASAFMTTSFLSITAPRLTTRIIAWHRKAHKDTAVVPSFGSQLTYRPSSDTAAAPFSKIDLPYLPRGPGKGDAAGRPWQGCHNSEVPLPVRLANTAGLRLKSVDGREQVSLSAVLSSRLICQIRSEACGDRSNSLMLLSWRRAPCRYHTAFVPETPYI